MISELQIIKFISNNLPNIPYITGVVNYILKPIFFRKERQFEVESDFFGMKVLCDLRELVEGAMFFYPHLYEKKSRLFLNKHLKRGDVFLDVGANVGFYSLLAANLVGQEGKVVAIEADKRNYTRLQHNINLNEIENIETINKGVSNKHEILKLYQNPNNRGGNSFLFKPLKGEGTTINVECETLNSLLNLAKIDTIKIMKIDIEGFEFKVLEKYFESGSVVRPEYIMIEHFSHMTVMAGGDALDLLKKNNYTVILQDKYDFILKFKG